MKLNEIGEIAHNEWINTEKVRKNVVLHSFVVMPNHIHGIIEIAHQCRGVLHTPNDNKINDDNMETSICNTSDNKTDVHNTPNDNKINDDNMETGTFNTSDNETGVCNTPLRSPSQTLGAIIRGYKSTVSKIIGFSVWQRNYHEHIIRNEEAYFKIHEYIENNPVRWEEDCFYS